MNQVINARSIVGSGSARLHGLWLKPSMVLTASGVLLANDVGRDVVDLNQPGAVMAVFRLLIHSGRAQVTITVISATSFITAGAIKARSPAPGAPELAAGVG